MAGDVEHAVNRTRVGGWLAPLLIAAAATIVALVLQNVLRSTWQIRSLPERVMEWLLLFVPLDLFEQGVQQLGGDAKEVALTGTNIGMALLLLVIGTVALRTAWRGWSLLGLGLGLWLFTMVVVMPVTGAGFFATGLFVAPLLTNAGYLLVFLAYSSVLLGGAVGVLHPRAPRLSARAPRAERRAFLAGVGGTLVAGSLAAVLGRQGGLVASTLPLAAAPTAAPPRPTATATAPAAAQQASAAATVGTVPTAAPGAPTATAAPVAEAFPNPPPPRRISRDKDGSLTAAGRPKGELAPPITSNDDFYIVTKNAVQDPIVDAATWRLIIDGEVNNPVQVDYRTLLALPPVELTKTLECISNFTAGCSLTSFGCDLISTARWKGTRLSDVLDLAGGLKSSAVGLAILSTDEFSAGLTVDVIQDPETLIVYEMNGQPLPREHGFPARLLVPGRYGMKNPKWLAGIRAMNQEYAGWYEQRNWNKDGIVKTMARIDTPADGSKLTPGPQRVAGIAYAGNRGIRAVEISADDGDTWLPAQIVEPMPGKDAQVRWEGMFTMPAGGTVTLTVRATDGRGQIQTDDFQLPQPDGASGRDQVTLASA